MNYSSPYWPKGRAQSFTMVIGQPCWNDKQALEKLATTAGISVKTLLNTNPLLYEARYMSSPAPLDKTIAIKMALALNDDEFFYYLATTWANKDNQGAWANAPELRARLYEDELKKAKSLDVQVPPLLTA